jgi:hypothetical protein
VLARETVRRGETFEFFKRGEHEDWDMKQISLVKV